MPDIPAGAAPILVADLDEAMIRTEDAARLTGRNVEWIRELIRQGRINGATRDPRNPRFWLIPYSALGAIRLMPSRKPIERHKVTLIWTDGRAQTFQATN